MKMKNFNTIALVIILTVGLALGDHSERPDP